MLPEVEDVAVADNAGDSKVGFELLSGAIPTSVEVELPPTD